MALSGFQKVRIGIMNSIDDETIKPENIFEVSPKTGGSTVSASITNLAPTTTPINGSDTVWKTPGKGTGNVSVAFVANVIPKEVRQRILGMDVGEGFASIGSNTDSPYCVFEMISHDAQNEDEVSHVTLLKGTFHLGNVDPKTNTNTSVYSQDQLTYTAVDRQSDNRTYVEAIEDDSFDKRAYETFVYGQELPEDLGTKPVAPVTDPKE